MSQEDHANVQDISARRLQKLANENRELRQYVAEVMQRLRANEQLFRRMFELESKLLRCTDPEDLCFTLLRGLRAQFDLDFARFWFDRASFMGNQSLQSLSERDLVWLEHGEIEAMGLNRQQVLLIRLDGDGFAWLTAADAHLGSLALLTLGELEHPFGVLGLGAIDRDRFAPGQATDFLMHLGQVLSLSLENAVAQARLARMSVTDTLTGSRNRRFLQPRSHQPLSQWFGDVPVCCLYIDMDHFKQLNDEHGHEFGDRALSELCARLRRFMRAQDPLIRMGGDEFVVLLPGCPLTRAQQIAERMLKAIVDEPLEGQTLSASFGLAERPADEDWQVQQLIKRADEAMYVAKALGGGRVELWSGD